MCNTVTELQGAANQAIVIFREVLARHSLRRIVGKNLEDTIFEVCSAATDYITQHRIQICVSPDNANALHHACASPADLLHKLSIPDPRFPPSTFFPACKERTPYCLTPITNLPQFHSTPLSTPHKMPRLSSIHHLRHVSLVAHRYKMCRVIVTTFAAMHI